MTKNKHDHTATKKIKAWLFAIMLLLPFLFLLPTGLYYGLNQNAQLSERTEQQATYYDTNEVVSTSDLIVNNAYYWINDNSYTSTSDINTFRIDIESNTFNSLFPNRTRNNDDIFYISTYSSGIRVKLYQNNSWTDNVIIGNREFPFLLIGIIDTSNAENLLISIDTYSTYFKEYVDITYNNDISTSIINAWNSTWQNPLFSWTNYSPFYAPMQSFTNVFGINNMQIANVLTYLATITAIYIVFDIVIELFTYLTHLIPRSD